MTATTADGETVTETVVVTINGNEDAPTIHIDGPTQGGPISFAHVFPPGKLWPEQVRLEARLSSTSCAPIPAQVDILRHNEDGSIRHALFTIILTTAPHGDHTVVELSGRAKHDEEPSQRRLRVAGCGSHPDQ